MLPLKSIGYLFRPPARPPAQAFTDSIQGDWGGGPMEDIKAGVLGKFIDMGEPAHERRAGQPGCLVVAGEEPR